MINLKNKLQQRSNSLSLLKIAIKQQHKSRKSIDSSQMKQSKIQKSYIKSQYESIKNPFVQITNKKHERRASKLISTKKISLSIQKHTHRKTFEITPTLSSLQLVIAGTKQMIYLLQRNFIISQKQSSYFYIKNEDLEKLLQTVLFFKTNIIQEKLLKENQQFEHCLSSLWKTVENQIKKHKTQSFNYFHKVNFRVTHEDYKYQVKQKKEKIWELQELLKQKKVELSELDQSLKESHSHKQAVKLLIREKEACFDELCQKCKEKEHMLSRLQAETAKKEEFLRHVQEREQVILNFVNNQQKSKMVKVISEEYKQIESDLYEYAVFLQANQLASSLTYEHLPIICHTHGLDQELNIFCKNLLHSQEQSLEEKCLQMKKFVLQVHNQYKKQVTEMQKLMDFKTGWIIKYVEKMKKWLSNWELKQEYLKNLRIQYLLTNQNIMSILTEQRSAEVLQLGFKEIQEVIRLFLKLSENFEMGNSFY